MSYDWLQGLSVGWFAGLLWAWFIHPKLVDIIYEWMYGEDDGK